MEEGDIATYTVLAADDPRAANRTLYVKPPANTLSHNELLALWETKTGRAFERVHIPEDAVLKQIQGQWSCCLTPTTASNVRCSCSSSVTYIYN